MTRLFVLYLSIAAAAGLLSCATHPPAPNVRVEGNPLPPAEQVAWLALHTSRTFPGRPKNIWWWVDVLSVDGKLMGNNSAVVTIAPGQHTIEYMCLLNFRVNDTGGAKSQGTIKVLFEPGKTYYAYAKGKMTSYHDYGATGIESQGYCEIDNFSEKNPNTLP